MSAQSQFFVKGINGEGQYSVPKKRKKEAQLTLASKLSTWMQLCSSCCNAPREKRKYSYYIAYMHLTIYSGLYLFSSMLHQETLMP